MQGVVIDTNLVIDVEMKRANYQKVLSIKTMHEQGTLQICIPAIMATEKQINGKIVDNYKLFKQYIESLGFLNTIDLRPPCYIGMSYVGYCILAGGGVSALLDEIHQLLFQPQKIEFDHRDYCNNRGFDPAAGLQKEWKNAICDSIMLWSAVYYEKSVFITRDQNFHNHSRDIKSKYGVEIKRPADYKPIIETSPHYRKIPSLLTTPDNRQGL